jgi:predicted transcriptional regulator
MTRAEAIAKITASLARLSDEHIEQLAEIAARWSDDSRPAEDDETRAAIAEGIAQADRGDFASDAEVAEAYARSAYQASPDRSGAP